MKVNSKFFLIVFILAVGLIAGYYLGYDHGFENAASRTINDFYSCAAAGYAVQESHPRQCRTPDGRSFAEEIENGKSGSACTQEAKLCPDGSYVSRVGPECEFAPCSLEL